MHVCKFFLKFLQLLLFFLCSMFHTTLHICRVQSHSYCYWFFVISVSVFLSMFDDVELLQHIPFNLIQHKLKQFVWNTQKSFSWMCKDAISVIPMLYVCLHAIRNRIYLVRYDFVFSRSQRYAYTSNIFIF